MRKFLFVMGVILFAWGCESVCDISKEASDTENEAKEQIAEMHANPDKALSECLIPKIQ
jgi:hypothetical protein